MVRVVPEGRVAFGIQLPIQAQSHLFVEPWEPAAGPKELVDVARVAEQAYAAVRPLRQRLAAAGRPVPPARVRIWVAAAREEQGTPVDSGVQVL